MVTFITPNLPDRAKPADLEQPTALVVVYPSPFPQSRRILKVSAGLTITDMLARAAHRWGVTCITRIDGVQVPRAMWRRVRVKAGHTLTVEVVPQGGGGGGKDIWRLVAMIGVLIVASIFTMGFATPYLAVAFGTTMAVAGKIALAIGATIAIGGMLAVNALIPPTMPKLGAEQKQDKPGFAITGTRNSSNPFGVIPQVLGSHRMYPMIAAAPFTEMIGNTQYLRMLFCLGYGPVDVDDWKIGETALSEFDGLSEDDDTDASADVEMQIQYGEDSDEPITLYKRKVHETVVGVPIERDAGFTTRTTEPLTTKISIDLVWPQGLVRFDNDDGEKKDVTAKLVIQRKRVDVGPFTGLTLSSNSATRKISRSTGSFVTDGFKVGDVIDMSGWATGSMNNKRMNVTAVSALELTVDRALTDETNRPNVTINMAWSFEETNDALDTRSIQIGSEVATEAPHPGMDVEKHRRVDSVIMSKEAGELKVLRGRRSTVLTSWPAGPSFDRRKYWHLADIRLGSGGASPNIAATHIIDKRSTKLINLSGGAGDFAVTAGLETDQWVNIAAGNLSHAYTITSRVAVPLRRERDFDVPEGTYDVRIKNISVAVNSDSFLDRVEWSVLRSFITGKPIKRGGLALVAIRIKATDQLNGMLQELNAIVTTKAYDLATRGQINATASTNVFTRVSGSFITDGVKVGDSIKTNGFANDANNGTFSVTARTATTITVDGTLVTETGSGDEMVWVERGTQNPASLFRHILQGRANSHKVTSKRLDLNTLADWHDECKTKGFTYNKVIDSDGTIFERLQEVAAAGRASFNFREGKFSVIRDISQTTPVQHFSPRNIGSSFKGVKIYHEQPHALRVNFVNEDAGYGPDQLVVYDTGYSEDGTEFGTVAATLFEEMELPGVTTALQAWKLARYHLAVGRLRSEMFEVTTDFEHLVCTRGDLVRIVHDVPSFGLGQARIKTISGDGLTYTLDQGLTMETGKLYAIRLRDDTNASHLRNITTVVGEQTSITLASAISSAKVGDLLLFGEQGSESKEMIVRMIEPQTDMSARLMLVAYAQDVLTADANPPASFTTNQATHLDDAAVREAPIIVAAAVTEESTRKGKRYGLAVTIRSKVFRGLDAQNEIVGQIRVNGTNDWKKTQVTSSDRAVVEFPRITYGETYDIRVRTRSSRTAVSSRWAKLSSFVATNSAFAPRDVPTPVKVSKLGVLNWSYGGRQNIQGFRVKYMAGRPPTATYASATEATVTTETRFDTTTLGLDAGTYTYFIKAVGEAGLESTNARVVVITTGDLGSTGPVITTRDEHTLGFPGTKTNCAVNGSNGNLEATVGSGDSTPLWTTDSNALWSGDDNKPLWSSDWTGLTYITPSITPAAGTNSITLDYTIAGSGVGIEYSIDGGPWTSFDGTIEDVNPAKPIRFRITTIQSSTRGIVSEFKIEFRAKATTQVVSDVTIAVGGTRLAVGGTFGTILDVGEAAVQDDGNGGVELEVIDLNAASGPLVKVKNSAGSYVAGLVDATVQGY